ncbi:MAG: tetratricopeptide repeat protein [Candidatus Gracilibacteria bacterium]|jgi:tetratricopeptide (TPR) repeat protein
MSDEQTYNEDPITEADKLKLEGHHKEAIKLCEKILLEDLECEEAYEEIGDNYLSLREFDKALKALNHALKLNPRSANSHYLKGFTFSAIGEWKKSIQELDEANSIQPNHPEILRCLGWSVFHGEDRTKGLVLLERALVMAKDDVLIICDLAVCYLNERKFERTIGLLNHALKVEPENKKARDCLQTALFFQKEFKKLNK